MYETFLKPMSIVGHRGYKSKYVENTMQGFLKCYESGAICIETDLWLTKDNVLVISHDKSTKRVFCTKNQEQTNFIITESTYDQIKDLQTIESGEKLIKFKEFLDWYLNYCDSHNDKTYQIMLDIKEQNPAKIVKYVMMEVLEARNDMKWWVPRVQLGLWNLSMLKYMNQDEYFQKIFKTEDGTSFLKEQLDIFQISVNWKDSAHFLDYNHYLNATSNDRKKFTVSGISLLFLQTWSYSFLRKFVPRLENEGIKLWSWTINSTFQIEFFERLQRASRIPELGIITDYPGTMADHTVEKIKMEEGSISEGSTKSSRPRCVNDLRLTFKQRSQNFFFNIFITLFGVKRISNKDLDFAARVDPNHVTAFKPSAFFIFMFTKAQKLGLF